MVIALPEQIDVSNAAGVAEKLTAAVSHEAAVIIDMSATRFCDCAGARAIVRAYKRATDSGTELRLVVTAAPVRRIFGPAEPTNQARAALRAGQVSCTCGRIWVAKKSKAPSSRPPTCPRYTSSKPASW